MHHPNVLGAGAAARRKYLDKPQDKVHVVMKEFKKGTLHSGSGSIVTNRKQAIAIAMREAGKSQDTKQKRGRMSNDDKQFVRKVRG